MIFVWHQTRSFHGLPYILIKQHSSKENTLKIDVIPHATLSKQAYLTEL